MSEEKETASATWKFDFEDTVSADPKAKGICLGVIRAYLNFCSKSNPLAFCSLSELMLRTSSSRPAVLRAKENLERLGYLTPLYVTDEGATMYRLVNARKSVIDEHLRIARESLAAEKRDRKRRERKKVRGSNETIPPETDNFERNDTPVLNETLPNTVEELRRDSCSEGSNGTLRGINPSNDNPYGLIDDDPTVPFSVPDDDAEADEILSHFGNVNPTVLVALRRMLMAGQLTPAMLSANLGGSDE